MVEGLRSFIVLGSIVGLCVFLRHWIHDEVLPCPKTEIVYRERPYSFKEWSDRDDRTWSHFKSLFTTREPDRFQDTSKAGENILPDYQRVIDYNSQESTKRVKVATERKILQHPALDSYLRAGGISERVTVWERDFEPDGISFEDLERFRMESSD